MVVFLMYDFKTKMCILIENDLFCDLLAYFDKNLNTTLTIKFTIITLLTFLRVILLSSVNTPLVFSHKDYTSGL